MSKQHENTNQIIRKLTIPGGTNNLDKGALLCDLMMLCIFAWNQICYGMNMLFLIIPLVLVGLYLVLFCILPEKYCFTENGLEIQHKCRKTEVIPYESVFNYEASSKDTFINIMQRNRVKVYYMQGKRKAVAICVPKDVDSFVETLKWNCPEFREETREKSKLEVFFGTKE